MRSSNLLFALSTIGSGFALERRGKLASVTSVNSTILVAKRYIIERAPGSNNTDLKNEIASRPGATVLKEFNSKVFSGLSLETTEDNIDSLQALESVSKAWVSNKIKLGTSLPETVYNDNVTITDYSVHSATGVDKLHDAGIYGKGAVVAIVDTGTQYTHPALGGGFGPGYKVAGGYDFVGDGCWPDDGCAKEPDSDPMDQLGHGTHVAGILGGQSAGGFIGVAPEATILSYKVFTSIDGTDDDTLIDAFLTAYEAGADIITSSVGGAGGFSDDAWATVASRLVEEGVVVTIAAGNDGEEGPFFASNGAAGEFVVAVASTEASTMPAAPFLATFNLDGESNTTKVAYLTYTAFPTEFNGWPIVPLSGNLSAMNEACDPLPETTANLSTVIPLVRLGGCESWEKAINLGDYGAQYVLLYNDDEPLAKPYGFGSTVVATIGASAGAAIIETVAAGGNVTADFSLDPNFNYIGMENPGGGVPNFFTSWGGLYDMSLKPEIAAPGGDILSTYPNNTYAVLSGTSMATPYIAGIAALYIGQYGGRNANPNFDAKQLAMRIISSGGSIPWSDGSTTTDYGFWAPVPQVGTGMINASNVLGYTTSLSYAKFELNDTHHFSRYHSVDITNNGKSPVTYNFALQDGAGVEMWQPEDPNVWGSPRMKYFEELVPVTIVPQVSFPSAFTLSPGETKTADFGFNYPTGFENMPLYSGKILISSSEGEQLSVPYYGLASNLKDDMSDEFPASYPASRSTSEWIPIAEKSNYTFNLTADGNDFPVIFSRNNWGVEQLRWDIFESTWTERKWVYPPVPGQNGYIGNVAYWAESGCCYSFDPATNDVNDTIAFPLTDVSRSSVDTADQQYWWLGRLGDGTQIQPGDYVMRFAVLAPFGDPTHSDNWDTFTTPFTVLPLV